MRHRVGAVVLGLFLTQVIAQAQGGDEKYSPSTILRGGSIYYTIANWRANGASMSVGTFNAGGTDTLPSIPFVSDAPITLTAEDPANPEVSLLHAFTINANGNVMHARYIPGRWSAWENLGGNFVSRPSATWYNGKIHLFALTRDGLVAEATGSGSNFSSFLASGVGGFSSTPAATTGPDGIHLAVRRGQDVQHARIGPDGWSAWESLGCCAAGEPAITFIGSGVYEVLTRGTDNAIYRQTYNATTRSGWSPVRGGVTTASPAVVRDLTGAATMFVYGQQRTSYYNTRNSGTSWGEFHVALANVSFTASTGSTSGYGSPNFINYAPFQVRVTVHYSACETVSFVVNAATDNGNGNTVPGRGAGGGGNICLLTRVTGDPVGPNAPAGVSVDLYQSSGTSYRKFYIVPYAMDIPGRPDEWQILSSHQWSDPEQGTAGMSPGFAITNKTLYPVFVSLDQAGCLYYDIINPGESFNRATGAVWFTISAHIEPRGKGALSSLRQDLLCAEPIVSITTSVLMGFATGAAAQWAGMTAAQNVALVGRAFARFLPVSAIKSGASEIAQQLASTVTSQLLQALTDNQSVHRAGQYAGGPWPFRCAQKPMYEITGGWGPTQVDADENRNIDPGSKLVITKTNSCGDGMMIK